MGACERCWENPCECKSSRPGNLRTALERFTPTEAWAAMTPEQRLAMAKAAPKVAGPWRLSEYPMMVDGHGEVPAWERGHLGGQASIILFPDDYLASVRRKDIGRFPSLTEAQAACDAALVAQGWVLE